MGRAKVQNWGQGGQRSCLVHIFIHKRWKIVAGGPWPPRPPWICYCHVLFLGGRLPCNVIVYKYEILFYIAMYATYTTRHQLTFDYLFEPSIPMSTTSVITIYIYIYITIWLWKCLMSKHALGYLLWLTGLISARQHLHFMTHWRPLGA